MGKNPIVNPMAPLLVGLDHDDTSLIAKAKEIVGQFGKKGKTFFVEGPPQSAKEKKETDYSIDSFLAAEKEAIKKGMKVVRLDSSIVAKTKRKMTSKGGFVLPKLAGLNRDEFCYFVFQVRERHWLNILRKQAGGGDIVMAHQNHIVRIRRGLSHFGLDQNVLLVSKPTTRKEYGFHTYSPLSLLEVRKLKKLRAAKKPINLRLKK